jgi:hypothetical protein
MSMSMYIYIEMPNCLASGQSGTGLIKTNDAGTGPGTGLVCHFFCSVSDQNSGCRNVDAGISFLNANAQLCH